MIDVNVLTIVEVWRSPSHPPLNTFSSEKGVLREGILTDREREHPNGSVHDLSVLRVGGSGGLCLLQTK